MELEKEKKDKKKSSIKSWLVPIVIAVAFFIVLNRFVVFNFSVPSESMVPTLKVGDWIMGDRLAYLSKDPQRFDIITFPAPDEPEITLVKRIIGLPGETIEGKDNVIYIDGNVLEETGFEHGDLEDDFGPYTIPEDGYFMMGDNRGDSGDSREWDEPFVMREDIIAKARFQYVPKIKTLK